jgi:tRNA nucleotidyltransferase/poly(A) polymerase
LDYNHIKSQFKLHFSSELDSNPELKFLLYEIFVYGSAYIVGGYFRDFLNSKKSRDLDIIIDLDNDRLLEIVRKSNAQYTINRHKGIKLQFKNIVVFYSLSFQIPVPSCCFDNRTSN